jgi:uncharacterized membrane protein YedE/YeeE
VDAAGGLFFIGAWLVVLMGFLAIVALVGFYDTLRSAGPTRALPRWIGWLGLLVGALAGWLGLLGPGPSGELCAGGVGGTRFSVPSATTKTAATQRTSQRAKRPIKTLRDARAA